MPEECCYKCKYLLEVYDPLPKIEAPKFVYYCMLHFADQNSIMKLGGLDSAIKSLCDCFERKLKNDWYSKG